MFFKCSSLTSLNLSNFNTDNVKYMRYMFSGCSSLTSLNLFNFNPNNNMCNMFSDYSSLNGLNSKDKRLLKKGKIKFILILFVDFFLIFFLNFLLFFV